MKKTYFPVLAWNKISGFFAPSQSHIYRRCKEYYLTEHSFHLCFLSLFVSVVLYNCSVGREDCSLCKNTDRKYKCVWCDTTHSCIYSELCTKELEQCPAPTITDVRHTHSLNPVYFLQLVCSELFLTHAFTPDHSTVWAQNGADLSYYKGI